MDSFYVITSSLCKLQRHRDGRYSQDQIHQARVHSGITNKLFFAKGHLSGPIFLCNQTSCNFQGPWLF